MSRPLGFPKTGGRQKGTPNKRSQRIAEALEQFNYDPAKALLEKYPDLLLGDQMRIDMKLLDFVYPRPKSSESEIDDGEESAFPEDVEARKALYEQIKTDRYRSSREAALKDLKLLVTARPELLNFFKPELIEELNLK